MFEAGQYYVEGKCVLGWIPLDCLCDIWDVFV